MSPTSLEVFKPGSRPTLSQGPFFPDIIPFPIPSPSTQPIISFRPCHQHYISTKCLTIAKFNHWVSVRSRPGSYMPSQRLQIFSAHTTPTRSLERISPAMWTSHGIPWRSPAVRTILPGRLKSSPHVLWEVSRAVRGLIYRIVSFILRSSSIQWGAGTDLRFMEL